MSELREIFTKLLPSVPAVKRSAFLDGMRAYHEKFKGYRGGDMNYEADEQYQNEWVDIAKVDQTDYWVYSPQFSQVMGLLVNELFKTKIQHHSLPNPLSYNRDVILIDKHMNRWAVSFIAAESEPEKLRICMRFPRSKTLICTCGIKFVSENEISAADTKVAINVLDTSGWYES